VRIYLVQMLCDGKDYLFDEYNYHKATIHAQTFVDSDEGY